MTHCLALAAFVGLKAGAAAPTVSPISDIEIPVNQSSGPLAFRVVDDGGPASVVLIARSDNPTLIPNANIVLLAPDGINRPARTVTVTPVANASGVARITIIAEDGLQQQTSRSFLVTVTDPNPAPTITAIPDQFVWVNQATGDLPFTVADSGTPAGQLTVEAAAADTVLLPPGSFTLGGSDGARILRASPASATSGSSLISVTVSDGSRSTSTQFLLTVVPFPGLAMPQAGELRWQGLSNVSYIVVASTNLNDWSALGTATSTTATFSFSDSAPCGPHRFYSLALP